MLDLNDFQRTYILDEVSYSNGIPSSRVGLFNQNVWALNDIVIEGRTEYVHSVDEKLYFMPGVMAARIKVRDFLQKNGGSIVKEPARATTIFYSEDTVKEMFVEYSMGCIKLSKAHFLNWLKAAYLLGDGEENKESLENVYHIEVAKVNDSKAPFVVIGLMARTVVEGSAAFAWHGGTAIKAAIPQAHFAQAMGIAVRSDCELKLKYISSPLLCHRNGIVKYLNTKEITPSMYHELGVMLTSDDDKNVIMAIEIMANCDYNKSIVYLLVLLRNHSFKIRMSKGSDQVNFKTMVSYLGTSGINEHVHLEDLAKILSRNGQNTKVNRELLIKLVAPSFFNDEGVDPEIVKDETLYEEFPEDDVDLEEELL